MKEYLRKELKLDGRSPNKRNNMEIEIVKEKFLGIIVCSDITPKELKDESKKREFEKEVNLKSLCGTRHGWILTKRIESKPVKCAREENKGRWHYVFDC